MRIREEERGIKKEGRMEAVVVRLQGNGVKAHRRTGAGIGSVTVEG